MGRELIIVIYVFQISLVTEVLNDGKVDVPDRHRPFGLISVLDIEEGKVQLILSYKLVIHYSI